MSARFNAPPGWPEQEVNWQPPKGWAPDPTWPPAPSGWVFWVEDDIVASTNTELDEDASDSKRIGEFDSSPDRVNTDLNSDEVEHLLSEIAELRNQIALLTRSNTSSSSESTEIVELNDERVLQEVGIYRYHHPLENSEAFRNQLNDLQDRIKGMIKEGEAILASEKFTFDNSLAKGRKMTMDFSKLMLRAYNSEADNCVRTLRAGNVITAKKRLEASSTSIQRLASMMEMRINPDYHALRLEELEITSDYFMKVQEEKDAAREERERLREERKAEQELAAERERLEKERAHYANALAAIQSKGDDEDATELKARIAELDETIAQNDFRAANIRAGYVYVISNEGSFGRSVVKIGMTRRLEPMDRVRELGDASVPFPYDVHALWFADDAVTLESELHKHFASRRVNVVNERREFFFATPEEVREVLAEKAGNLLEFTEKPEATQFHQSRSQWPRDLERF